MPKKVIKNILSEIEALPNNLHPAGSRKIMGTEHTYRQRVGDYRIIYSIERYRLIIEVIRVGHRKEVYRKNV